MKMKLYSTLWQDEKIHQTEQEITLTDESAEARAVEMQVVNVYPQATYQTIVGFGGAMTEAAGFALAQLSEEDRQAALKDYFGVGGNGATVVRTHIDSCDFSLGMYTAVADPTSDPEFTTFTLDRDRQYIIPAIKGAMAVADKPLSVLLSPWSPPAAWKTPPVKMVIGANAPDSIRELMPKDPTIGNRCWGGHLKPEFYSPWAKYMTMYIQGYLDEGIPVKWVSIQNEAMAVHRCPDQETEHRIDKVIGWLTDIPSVRLLVPSDTDFPQRFLTLPQPPLVVLAAGNIELMKRPTVSLVGSSHPSSLAESTTQSWVQALMTKNLSLVQGDSEGIEKIGLMTALQSNSDLLVIVTKNPLMESNFEQKLLFMSNKGLLLSPLENSPDPWLARQRLLIASTDHFVVIQASIRSKVLPLIREAADTGRNIMAVPGSIHSPLSKGCHKLIREGAKLVESVDDIFNEIEN